MDMLLSHLDIHNGTWLDCKLDFLGILQELLLDKRIDKCFRPIFVHLDSLLQALVLDSDIYSFVHTKSERLDI